MKFLALILFLMASMSFASTLPIRNEIFSSAAGLDASFKSGTTTIYQRDFAIHCSWTEDTASLTGFIELETSGDFSNWSAVASASTSMAGAGNYIFEISGSNTFHYRENVTISSGSSTVSCQLNAKPI